MANATVEVVEGRTIVTLFSASEIGALISDASDRLTEVEDAIADFDAAVSDAVASTTASAAAADADRIAAGNSATAAANTYNAILAVLAAGAFGPPYLTKAAADAAAAAGTIAANALCFVAVDETQNGVPTIRKRVGTATTTTFQTTVFGLATKFVAALGPFTGANSSDIGQTIFEALIPPGMLNSTGTDDAVPFRIAISGGLRSNGPTGHVEYNNYTFGMGWNITQNFGVDNAAAAATSLRVESKYYQGVFGAEIHLPEHAPLNGPTSGYAWRPITIFVPTDYDDRWSPAFGSNLTGNTFILTDCEIVPRIQIAFAEAGGGQMSFPLDANGGCIQLAFDKNNQAPVVMKNAAGLAFLSLPYFDARDMLLLMAAYTCQGASPATGVNTAAGFMAEYQDASPRAGGGFLTILPNAAVAGDYTGLQVQTVDVSGTLRAFDVYNVNATGGASGILTANGDIDLIMQNDGGGNPARIRRNGTTGALEIHTNGSARVSVSQSGEVTVTGGTLNLSGSGGQVRVNGQKVLGARQSAISEPTDLPTAITSINEIRIALQNMGTTW